MKKDYKPLHEALRAYEAAMANGNDYITAQCRSVYEAAAKALGEDPDDYLAQSRAIARALRKGF